MNALKIANIGTVVSSMVGTTFGVFFTFSPLTIAIGGVAYTLTTSQVTTVVASLAGLAIAYEALAIAGLSRLQGRRKRDVEGEHINLVEPFFKAVQASDDADCGKLLICNAMAKNAKDLTSEEVLILKLFADLRNIKFNTAYGTYQWAAYAGTFKSKKACLEKYGNCPIPADQLADFIRVKPTY